MGKKEKEEEFPIADLQLSIHVMAPKGRPPKFPGSKMQATVTVIKKNKPDIVIGEEEASAQKEGELLELYLHTSTNKY